MRTINFFTEIINMFFKYSRYFLEGTRVTVILSVVVVVLGSILGALIAMMKLSKNPILNGFASAYISVLRGTPLYVQLMIIYVLIGRVVTIPRITILWMSMERTAPAIIALTMNSASYVAEIIRAGIQAVDPGQTEAARSIGMTSGQAMRLIIMPQAIKNILPAIGNEFITMIKETSIIRLLGVQDLMYGTNIVITTTYRPIPALLNAAFIYYILNLVLSRGVNAFERRLQASDRN